MPVEVKQPLDYEPRPTAGDDVAYLLPMGTFLLFTWLGTYLKDYYPVVYAVKTIAVAALLVRFWRQYTAVRWDYWWLGLILGVVSIVQWVGMQLWLQRHVGFFRPPDAKDVFDPFRDIGPPGLRWAFVGVRLAGAVLVVPVMEELFWRDYLWRRVISPNDFRLAAVGEWDAKAFVLVPLCFAVVHGNWWLTSIVWAFMIGGLLAVTRSLGACIVMHATANLLLGAYVLWYRDWAFW